MVANKDISAFFYESGAEGQYKCRFPPEFVRWWNTASELSQLFYWMRWVVQMDLPISKVEDDLTQSMSKWEPVTAKALREAMEGVFIKVGEKMEVEMGASSGLIFDDWSYGSMHFVGLCAVYCVDGQLRTPDAHIKLLLAVLGIYNKTAAMVHFLVGDNGVTNKAIATKMAVPLKLLASYEPILETINGLMVQLRKPNNAAELAKLTELLPVKRIMTHRYSKVRLFKQVDAV
ncbi:hypothetical protein PHMEG_00032258 [Phytophthora megakarya]|uniref:Uncharacterized protein n=1 Tax=Phytophthora megakarya TaxID=4795 RepID=A0A225UW08_9STRA|nr:hypothetical protein PHMEG_00032258 [Phytophthora megakarya]